LILSRLPLKTEKPGNDETGDPANVGDVDW
jgi:hypothetical protein